MAVNIRVANYLRMSLNPRDEQHAGQIAAGTSGRNRGHAFEQALSLQIRKMSVLIDYNTLQQNNHLFQGDPATELIRYILHNEQFDDPVIDSTYWLGGLATSGKGDTLLCSDGEPVRKSKSDLVIKFCHSNGDDFIGVSVKTCFNKKPTNAQLYCSTAGAFSALLRQNGVEVSDSAEDALKMFCGEPGFRPMDDNRVRRDPHVNNERWFWEELPNEARREWENLFDNQHRKILTVLLRDAYEKDCYRPKYILHLRNRSGDEHNVPLAIYTVEELVNLSHEYRGFYTRESRVRKGRFKNDPNLHKYPGFGIVQFQQLGNKQNRSQLQFNLQANYFNKIISC